MDTEYMGYLLKAMYTMCDFIDATGDTISIADIKQYETAVAQAIEKAKTLEKIKEINNRYWHSSHGNEIGDREALRMIYDILSEAE